MRRSSEQSRKRGKEFFFFIQIGDEVVNHLHSSKTPCRFNVCFRPWQSREDSHFICVLTNLGTYQLGSPVKFFRRALYEMHRIRWYFLVIFRGGRGVAVCVSGNEISCWMQREFARRARCTSRNLIFLAGFVHCILRVPEKSGSLPMKYASFQGRGRPPKAEVFFLVGGGSIITRTDAVVMAARDWWTIYFIFSHSTLVSLSVAGGTCKSCRSAGALRPGFRLTLSAVVSVLSLSPPCLPLSPPPPAARLPLATPSPLRRPWTD